MRLSGGYPTALMPTPGRAPSTTSAASTTALPPTTTYSIPVGGRAGCSYVELSMTLSASKTTMSASMPGLIRPLVANAGARRSNL